MLPSMQYHDAETETITALASLHKSLHSGWLFILTVCVILSYFIVQNSLYLKAQTYAGFQIQCLDVLFPPAVQRVFFSERKALPKDR